MSVLEVSTNTGIRSNGRIQQPVMRAKIVGEWDQGNNKERVSSYFSTFVNTLFNQVFLRFFEFSPLLKDNLKTFQFATDF